jgi:hypothetical protein
MPASNVRTSTPDLVPCHHDRRQGRAEPVPVRSVLSFIEAHRDPKEGPPAWDLLLALWPEDRKAPEAILVERGMRALPEAARPAGEEIVDWNLFLEPNPNEEPNHEQP